MDRSPLLSPPPPPPPFSKCDIIAFPTSETRLQEKKKNDRLSERGYYCILIPNQTARRQNEPKQDIIITAPWRWGVKVCVPVIMFIRNMGFFMRLAMPPDPPFIADAIAITPKGPSKPELYALSSAATSQHHHQYCRHYDFTSSLSIIVKDCKNHLH